MKLSIVIPAKNEQVLLPKLMEAIRSQKGVELEVIVADAHSTDATRERAIALGARIVDGGMPGPGRNAGAKHATGEWLCFHDADMLPLDEHFYERVLQGFSDRGADFGTVRLVPDETSFKDVSLHWLYHLNTKLMAPFVPHIAGGCFFVKRAWHQRMGGFDESVIFAEDMEYAQRLHAQGARFAYLSEPRIQISVRRLKKDGYARISWRFIYAEYYMRVHGPIRKELFDYSFDHTKPQKGV